MKKFERPNIEYTAGNYRDPFYPQVFLTKKKEEPKIEERKIEEPIKPKPSELLTLSVQGLIWNPDNPLVIINNQVLKRGDTLLMPKGKDVTGEVTIKDIDKDSVTIIYSGQEEKLLSPVSSELYKIKEE